MKRVRGSGQWVEVHSGVTRALIGDAARGQCQPPDSGLLLPTPPRSFLLHAHTHTHIHASGQLQVYSTLQGKTTRYCMTLSTSVTVSSRTLSCWGLVFGGVNPVVKSRGTSLCWENGKSCSKRTLQLSTVCACVIFAWATVCIFNRGVGCNNSKWATGAPSGRWVQRGGWEELSTIRGGVGRVADQLDPQLFCFWSITIVEIV